MQETSKRQTLSLQLPGCEEDCHDENDWDHPLEQLLVRQLQLVGGLDAVGQTHSGDGG